MRATFACALLAVAARGQCSGHPVGVTDVVGTVACNEVDGTNVLPFFSMFSVPSERGGPVSFSYNHTPSVGVRPAYAVGWIALSTAPYLPGVPVYGMATRCRFYVPPDVLVPVLVPLATGCHVVYLGLLPPLPGLAGRVLFAQTWAQDLTVNRSMTTRAIRVVVQP